MPSLFSLLVLQLHQMKLKLGELLMHLCVRLLNDEQALNNLSLRQLQVAISSSIHIAVWVNAQRLWISRNRLPFLLLIALFHRSIRCAVLLIIGMGFCILQDRRLFDASTFRVQREAFVANSFNCHCLLFVDELIDGGFDQGDCPFAFLLIVFQQPGMWLFGSVVRLVRW